MEAMKGELIRGEMILQQGINSEKSSYLINTRGFLFIK